MQTDTNNIQRITHLQLEEDSILITAMAITLGSRALQLTRYHVSHTLLRATFKVMVSGDHIRPTCLRIVLRMELADLI